MNKIWLAAAACALALPSACTLAQGRPGGMRGGPGGQPGGMMGGPGGGMRRPRGPLTLNRVPSEALKGPLSLNDAQMKKMDAIRSKFRDQVQAMFQAAGGGMGGRPGMGGGPGMGGRPGMGGMGGATMQKNMDKIQTLAKKNNDEMMGVLNAGQRAKVPGLIATFEAVQSAGLPMGAAGDLKLTPAQQKKLGALGAAARAKQMRAFQSMGQGGDRGAMMEKFRGMRDEQRKAAMAVLTPAQRTTIDKYEKAHPRGGFGGMGGGMRGPGGPGMGPGGPGMMQPPMGGPMARPGGAPGGRRGR